MSKASDPQTQTKGFSSATSSEKLPIVACYVSEFLKKDMNHIYRQVTGLNNFEPVILTRCREEEEHFPFDPSKIHIIPKSSLRLFRRVWYAQILKAPIPLGKTEVATMRRALEESGAALLHIYFGHVAARLLPLLRETRLPRVVSFHGADATTGLDNSRYREALAEVFEHSTLVLGRSQALLDRLAGIGCPQNKLKLQRTGIPLTDWTASSRHPPEHGAWRFAQVCRFVPKKGLETTLRAFAKIRAQFPEARLTLAGDGPERARVATSIATLGLGDAVDLCNFLDRDGVKRVLADCHFFFHPSVRNEDWGEEGVPNAMLEAMALGIPPLATFHGGIPEAVENGISGLLVPENDDGALARAVIELMHAPPERYHAMSVAAAERIASEFSATAQTCALEKAYHEAIIA